MTTVSPWLVGQLIRYTLMRLAEICYKIQYPIRNNRNRGDPFSMRQIGICQKFREPQNSTWIILQPSPQVLSRLELTIDKLKFSSAQEDDPMSLHLIFLEYQSLNWDDYVEHLRMSLEPLVCFSSTWHMVQSGPNMVLDRSSALLQGRPRLQISRFRLLCRI